MPPKSVFPDVSPTAEGRLLYDVGSDYKVPLAMFSGKNDDWPIGEFRSVRRVGWVANSVFDGGSACRTEGASAEAIRLRCC